MKQTDDEILLDVFRDTELGRRIVAAERLVEASREVVNDPRYRNDNQAPIATLRRAVETYDLNRQRRERAPGSWARPT